MVQLRVQLAVLAAAGCGAAVLCLLSVGWALVANSANTHGVAAVVGGLALHALFAVLGISVGALLGRPLVRAPGATALGILAVAMLALIVPWSPVPGGLRVLENNRVDAARMTAAARRVAPGERARPRLRPQ